MKYEKLTAREKQIYRRGKIAGYYQEKARRKRLQEKQQKERYGDFDPKEAFEKALERSYGKMR